MTAKRVHVTLTMTRESFVERQAPPAPTRGSAPVPPSSPEWRDFALCKGMDVHGFFPAPEHAQAGSAHTQRVLAVCAKCPVADPCLAYALKHDEPGVWGGTTPRQRGQMKKALGSRRSDYVNRLTGRAS